MQTSPSASPRRIPRSPDAQGEVSPPGAMAGEERGRAQQGGHEERGCLRGPCFFPWRDLLCFSFIPLCFNQFYLKNLPDPVREFMHFWIPLLPLRTLTSRCAAALAALSLQGTRGKCVWHAVCHFGAPLGQWAATTPVFCLSQVGLQRVLHRALGAHVCRAQPEGSSPASPPGCACPVKSCCCPFQPPPLPHRPHTHCLRAKNTQPSPFTA